MSSGIYRQIVEMSMEQDAQQRTLLYLAQHLGGFLKRGERVLICFQEHKHGDLSWLMEQAVIHCGAVPVVWNADRKWKTMLRQAFINKASVIIGAPLLVLGLTKLMKAMSTPLYIRKVITAGYPCMDWMIEGIAKGFDCVVGGCFGLGITGVVAGFACGHSWGVHLRDSEYGVEIVDEKGIPVPDGQRGEIVIFPKNAPHLRLPMGEQAYLETAPCACGCAAPRLMGFDPGETQTPGLVPIGQELQKWTSILDCRLERSECGLDVEIVAFRGEKLPKLPTAARMNLRWLDIEVDEPFPYDPSLKNPALREEND